MTDIELTLHLILIAIGSVPILILVPLVAYSIGVIKEMEKESE